MDKGKNIKLLNVTMVLVLLFAGQVSASFKSCFTRRAVGCIFKGDKFGCLMKCFTKCVLDEVSSGLKTCKFRCAIDNCGHFIKDFHIKDVDKIENCVKECESVECSILPEQLSWNGSELHR
ncbi:hypothetical protein ACJIZ3_025507 [Penstemon smallii]|uniref:Uncharacterized protein n=1 Tax=Penstemon smallii TaxID=265156 RepID=A0ABD3TWI2_9LAMI